MLVKKKKLDIQEELNNYKLICKPEVQRKIDFFITPYYNQY